MSHTPSPLDGVTSEEPELPEPLLMVIYDECTNPLIPLPMVVSTLYPSPAVPVIVTFVPYVIYPRIDDDVLASLRTLRALVLHVPSPLAGVTSRTGVTRAGVSGTANR